MKLGFVVSGMYLACQIALPTSVLNAAPKTASANKSTIDSNKQAGHTKNDLTKQLSQQATRLIQEVEQARQAVAAKQTQAALSDIDHALSDRSQLASLAKANGRPMIVPLYTELDDSSTLGPVLAARKGKPQPNPSSPITVDDASAQFTFVGMDLDKAKSRLEAARTALHNNNPQAASDSLAAIGSDLVVQTEQTDLPLLAARENLGIAETAVKSGKYQEASAALKEASIDVDKYSKEGSAHHAHEASDLHKRIDVLTQTISQHHSTTAANTIDNWWHEVDGWFMHAIHS